MSNSTPIAKLIKTPSEIGCYLLKNEKDDILYIGKAKNLRKRISQHLQTNDEEKSKFLGLIDNWEVILTSNVKEALILEQKLIRQYRPRFNILLKDDHFYPYIKITGGNNPYYLLVRNIPLNRQKEEMYFGPFPDGMKANEMLQVLERLFPLAKCSGNLGKPCLYYSLQQCSGHCFQLVEDEYYRKVKQKILTFFQGKNQVVKKKILKSFLTKVANQEFELAKREKKILDNLEFFTSQQNIEFPDHRNYDFLGFHYQNDSLTIFFLIYRYGKLSTTEKDFFKIYEPFIEKEEIIFTYIYQFYQKNPSPNILCLSQKNKEWEEILKEKFSFRCQVPQRGRKKQILELAQDNARQFWRSNFQSIDKIETLQEIGNYLGINPPYFIEILDISNLFREDPVAGFLVCINGETVRNKSKIYQLNDTQEKSDVAWIAQACQKHYKKNKKLLPDLLIIDGGKSQVQAGLNALIKLGLKIPVIGLAKNDRHQTEKIIFSDFRSLNFEKKETMKLFFTNLQEEVHQYVISFHRKLHRWSSFN